MITNGFYRNLAQKISENLLLHVDGRCNEPKSRSTATSSSLLNSSRRNPVIKDAPQSSTFNGNGKSTGMMNRIDLAAYNFPSHFNPNCDDDYEEHDESEVAMMSFLLDGQLKKYQSLMTAASSSASSPRSDIVNSDSIMISGKDRNNNSDSNFSESSIIICSVCGQGFTSLGAFDQHEINNHPNIICNYIEMKMEHNIAITLLNWINHSPMGLLKSCKVPDIVAPMNGEDCSPNIQCTKCKAKFTSVSYLHQHIMTCASVDQTNGVITKKASCSSKNSPSSKSFSSKSSPRLKSPAHKKGSISGKRNRKAVQSNGGHLTSNSSSNHHDPKEIKNGTANSNKSLLNQGQNHKDRVKILIQSKSKENPRGKRRCPSCLRVFKYLGNFKRHVKAGCPGLNHAEGSNSNQNSNGNRSSTKRGGPLGKSAKLSKSDDNIQCENDPNNSQSIDIENEQEAYDEKSDSSTEVEGEDGKEAKKFDLWKVKQEYPMYAFKGSPAQHHSCPYCRRGFTYLANYRRHVREDCPIKNQESLKKQIRDSFQNCLLKTREALRKTWAQMNIVIPPPQSPQLSSSATMDIPEKVSEPLKERADQ